MRSLLPDLQEAPLNQAMPISDYASPADWIIYAARRPIEDFQASAGLLAITLHTAGPECSIAAWRCQRS
jgi:hypothetical protein